MAKTDATATFNINVDSNAAEVGKDAVAAFEGVAASVEENEAKIKAYNATLRKLRGSTDEVKAAKAALKGQVAALTDSNSKLILSVDKSGTGYADVVAKAKAAQAAQEKVSKAVKEITPTPIDGLRERITRLRDVIQGGGGGELMSRLFGRAAVGLVAAGSAAMVAGIAAIAAAIVGLGSALVVGGVALAKFIVNTGDAMRSMGLMREAAYGNAKDAAALGSQVERLARKLPLAREELNALSVDLSKAGFEGQTLVDTFEAMAGATAALDAGAASKIKGILEPGRLTGLAGPVTRLSMMGSGLDFDKIRDELARNMKIGVKEAEAALAEGRVPMATAAAAIKGAVNAQFGTVFEKMSLSLTKLKKDWSENFGRLTKDVNLEPILKMFRELVDMFDTSSVTGQALKGMIEAFGAVLGATATQSTPLLKKMFETIVLYAQEGVIALLRFRKWLIEALQSPAGQEALNTALLIGKGALVALAGAAGVLVAAMAPFIAVGAMVLKSLGQLWELAGLLKKAWEAIDFGEIARGMIEGLVGGLLAGGPMLVRAVTSLAGKVKDGFKETLGIHSPSKVFAEYGRNTAEGYEQGVESGVASANRATAALGQGAPASSGATAGPVSLTVNFNIEGGASDETVKAMQSPSFVNQLTRAIESVLAQGGMLPAT